MLRREFLKISAAVALGLPGALDSVAWAKNEDAMSPLKLTAGPHLFLDDHLIDSQSHLTRTTRPPERLPEPIITGGKGGDKNFQPYLSVLRDPVSQKFRVWYGIPADPPHSDPSHIATMLSDDGIHWQRPHKVLADPGGVEVRFGACVIDDGPPHENPDHRLKFGWYTGNVNTPPTGGLMVATSADGLNWKPVSNHAPVLPHNHDINSIFYDPIRKRYGAVVSMLMREPSQYGNRRITCQSTSDDLVHWTTPWPILIPDEHDQPGTEFYAMSGVIARGDLLVGLVKVLRDDLPADPGGESHGIGYTTLAHSRDGISWTRERTPFMQRNLQPRTWDHAMTWGDYQLPVNDEIFIYYGGYAQGHKADRFNDRQIGFARMKRDRYIAQSAADQAGTLRTRPMALDGSRLTVNAHADEIRVRLLDESGYPNTQFSEAILHGDSTAHPLNWNLKSLGGSPMRLEFTVRNGDLYGFNVVA